MDIAALLGLDLLGGNLIMWIMQTIKCLTEKVKTELRNFRFVSQFGIKGMLISIRNIKALGYNGIPSGVYKYAPASFAIL